METNVSMKVFHMGIWKNLNCHPSRDIMMVCEFLSTEYKKKLLEIAEIGELMAIGYTKKSAYNVREKGIISDERCEKLITILGNKARPILIQALREFASQINCQANCP